MLDDETENQRRKRYSQLSPGEIERQLGKASENAPGPPVAFLRLSGDPNSLNGYERKLTSDEERIDQQEKRDESQTGGGTNGRAPSGSRLRRHTNPRRIPVLALS